MAEREKCGGAASRLGDGNKGRQADKSFHTCDRRDRSNVDCLGQTGTDNAEVMFCMIPKMLVFDLICDVVCFAILHQMHFCIALRYFEL